MSRSKRKPGGVPETAGLPEATVEAVALLRGKGGHSIVTLRLPMALIERYTVKADPPELRAIIAGKMVAWVEAAP